MSRKDFEAIAAAIRAAALNSPGSESPEARAMRERIATAVARHCAATNPRFDMARFLAACGVL